ncbi:MAG TPA: DUF4224 domain-containing protein [Burkholderiaceae bacterium]|jgi:hypothetical protein|nr:DUF4224 domain-containing protein [Burkholderiaceae bacterium]
MSGPLPFLTDDEIRQIVTPLKQPAAIIRWFRSNGFPYIKVRPNGMPLIPRSYFDAVTSGHVSQAEPARAQLNVDAYLARFDKNRKSG